MYVCVCRIYLHVCGHMQDCVCADSRLMSGIILGHLLPYSLKQGLSEPRSLWVCLVLAASLLWRSSVSTFPGCNYK